KAQQDLAEWRAFVEKQIRGTNPVQKRHPSLWALQKGLCWLCGLPLDRRFISRDHLRPVSRGGRGPANNNLLAHRSCNAKRGNKDIYTREEALAHLAKLTGHPLTRQRS